MSFLSEIFLSCLKVVTLVSCFLFMGMALGGCKVANEYASQTEAVEESGKWREEIAAIGSLDRNYAELWRFDQKREAWKQAALPVFESTGVTSAQLFNRRTGYVRSQSDIDRKVLFRRQPNTEVTQGSGGWIPAPARYPIFGRQNQGILASRGRTTLYNEPYTLYAYDFFGEDPNYWLRCTFWEPVAKPE